MTDLHMGSQGSLLRCLSSEADLPGATTGPPGTGLPGGTKEAVTCAVALAPLCSAALARPSVRVRGNWMPPQAKRVRCVGVYQELQTLRLYLMNILKVSILEKAGSGLAPPPLPRSMTIFLLKTINGTKGIPICAEGAITIVLKTLVGADGGPTTVQDIIGTTKHLAVPQGVHQCMLT